MRVSDTHQLVFVSIPKSGSNTGFSLMENKFNGKPTGQRIDGHYVLVPEHCSDYLLFTFVRNPYERAVSIWNQIKGNVPFKEFCWWLVNQKEEKRLLWRVDPKLGKLNQHEHISKCNRFQDLHFLKLENLRDELPALLNGMISADEIPWENQFNHPKFSEIGDDECIEAINAWEGKGFEMFGYERLG